MPAGLRARYCCRPAVAAAACAGAAPSAAAGFRAPWSVARHKNLRADAAFVSEQTGKERGLQLGVCAAGKGCLQQILAEFVKVKTMELGEAGLRALEKVARGTRQASLAPAAAAPDASHAPMKLLSSCHGPGTVQSPLKHSHNMSVWLIKSQICQESKFRPDTLGGEQEPGGEHDVYTGVGCWHQAECHAMP